MVEGVNYRHSEVLLLRETFTSREEDVSRSCDVKVAVGVLSEFQQAKTRADLLTFTSSGEISSSLDALRGPFT